MKKTVATTAVTACLVISGASVAQAHTYVQNQAIGDASDYLHISAFSRSGLINQVKYDGFSKKNATLGTKVAARRAAKDEGITVARFWDHEATKDAKSYEQISHFSLTGMIQQLEYDGFTHSQASYGAHHAGY